MLSDDQSVVSVEAKGFGTGDGLLSQMYRLKLTYSPSGAGPATIVAKLSPPNAKARLTGSILSLFKYEHEFYTRGVAHKIGLNVRGLRASNSRLSTLEHQRSNIGTSMLLQRFG